MYEINTRLPGSWLSTRLGIDEREIEWMRQKGELFAEQSGGEWHYSAWQFGPGGKVPRAVREVVRAARSMGVPESKLLVLLKRRVGLTSGGRRLADLLYEGNAERVVREVQAAAA